MSHFLRCIAASSIGDFYGRKTTTYLKICADIDARLRSLIPGIRQGLGRPEADPTHRYPAQSGDSTAGAQRSVQSRRSYAAASSAGLWSGMSNCLRFQFGEEPIEFGVMSRGARGSRSCPHVSVLDATAEQTGRRGRRGSG